MVELGMGLLGLGSVCLGIAIDVTTLQTTFLGERLLGHQSWTEISHELAPLVN
jgi:hypothetical protein